MQTRMIADMRFNYASRALAVGEEFDATERDAVALAIYRRAHRKDGSAAAVKSKRRYRRRDMQAE